MTFLIGLCLWISLSMVALVISAVGAEDAPSELTIQKAPQRHDSAAARYDLAVKHLEQEEIRIEAAQTSFNRDLILAPDLPRSYVISFTEPVLVSSLLDAVEHNEVNLTTLFGWLGSPDSTQIGTAEHSSDDLALASSSTSEVVEQLKAQYGEALNARLRSIDEAVDQRARRFPNGILPGEILNGFTAHKQDVARVRGDVLEQGPSAFGIRCTCSPRSVKQLEQFDPTIRIRAVEEIPPVEGRQPIWPADPNRELIISTQGRHGR